MWKRLREIPDQMVRSSEYASIVYWQERDGKVFHQGRQIRGACADTFEVNRNDHVFIARDKAHVYYAWSKVKDADPATFTSLGDGYFADQSVAYYEYETSLKPLKGNDRSNFSVIGNSYARDGVHGYYGGRALRGCTTPLSLTLPSNLDLPACDAIPPFALDCDHVYFEGAALRGADLGSWRWLCGGFSRDAYAIYFGKLKLKGARVGQWSVVHFGNEATPYSQDGRSVYLMSRKIPKANPESFRLLSRNYATDGKRVYFVGRPVEEADAASFEVSPDDSLARDKSRRYQAGVALTDR